MANEDDDTTTAQAEANDTEVATEQPADLSQDVAISDAGPCKKHVKVTVDREAIDQRINEKFRELVTSTNVPVPGFRPGKAPRKLIEKRYQKEVFAEVKTEVLMASLEKLADDTDLSPLSPPDLDPDAILIPESGPMVYEFEVEVRPEFDLPDYKGLTISRPVHTFTDDEIKTETRLLLSPYGQRVPKDGADAKVEEGDLITADVVVKSDDAVLNELKEIRLVVNQNLVLHDGYIMGFADKLIGTKPGDKVTIDVTLSNNVEKPELQGQTVQAEISVVEIKTSNLEENDAVLEMFGVRSVGQLEEMVRFQLERKLEYMQRQSARSQVLQKLAGEQQWDLPEDLLMRQSRQTFIRRMMEMREAGISEEEIASRQRVLSQDIVRQTAAALKEHFVLQKIGELEKIEIDESDIDLEIERIAESSNESPRKVRARMEKEELIETLGTSLLERKALDVVLDAATYEDTPIQSVRELREDKFGSVDQFLLAPQSNS